MNNINVNLSTIKKVYLLKNEEALICFKDETAIIGTLKSDSIAILILDRVPLIITKYPE